MANRKRKRTPKPAREKLAAPTTDYPSADGDQVLTLRGAMSPATRQQYARETGPEGTRAAANIEDMRARAVEFLFERLVSGWMIAEIPTTKPKELITRYRVSTRDERAWITEVLREHCAEWFPDVKVP
jgi:hypothetical protein